MRKNLPKKGFTLVELLVVMSIIGVLAAMLYGGFFTSRTRGRDAARKQHLKELANALEMFYDDYEQYPPVSGGLISACPYNSTTQTGSPCDWGATLSFADDKGTVYMRQIPIDPVSSSRNYYYRVVGTSRQAFQLYSHLENTEDINCIGGQANCGVDQLNLTPDPNCGTSLFCNYAVTSANIAPTDDTL